MPRIWGAYIRRGLYTEGAYFRNFTVLVIITLLNQCLNISSYAECSFLRRILKKQNLKYFYL